jgi:hypothetical protein
MGPPASPSISSFETQSSSGIGRNFEVERLGLLLKASREDLREQQVRTEEDYQMMKLRYQERERRMQEAWAGERASYVAEITELKRQLTDRGIQGGAQPSGSEGTSRRGGGSRRG